LVEKLWWYW